MALTDYKALTSKGVIADTPASGFRYKYIQEMNFYLDDTAGAWAALAWSALGLGVATPGMHTAQVKNKWKVHIEGPGGEKLFEQTVEVKYTFVALLMSMMGGVALGMWTWWASGETITTTICDGKVLGEGEKPRTLGVEAGYSVPAGGSDYGTDHAIIWDEWFSPIYYCNLPAGSTFHVDFHNVGLSALRSSLSAIQTQVMEATGAFCRLPGFGMIVGARSGGEGMEVHAWHSPLGKPERLSWEAPVWTSGVGTSGGRAQFVPYPGGGRIALVWEGNGAILYAESCNLGDLNGWEGPATVLPGHTLLGADGDTDGTVYLLTRDPAGAVVGYRLSRSVDRETLVRVSEPVPCLMESGQPLTLTSVDRFEVRGGVAHVIVDRGTSIDYYQGLHGMAVWVQAQE